MNSTDYVVPGEVIAVTFSPKVAEITVSVRRNVQPRQYESTSIEESLTFEPDPNFTIGQNLDNVLGMLRGRMVAAVAAVRQED